MGPFVVTFSLIFGLLGPGRPRERPEIVMFPSFFDFFSKTGLDRAPERFVGPSGIPQGPFLDVFWSIFEVNSQTKNYGNIVFLRTLSSNLWAFSSPLSCGQVTLIRATDELLIDRAELIRSLGGPIDLEFAFRLRPISDN